MGSEPARVLTVCTGNICRSPYAERILAMYFPPDQVVVDSAGLGAVVGADIEDQVKRLMPERTLRTVHVAKMLEPEHLESFDIILTMTKDQRADAVKMLPKAVRKVFTLREAARLIMSNPQLPVPGSAREGFVQLADLLTPVRGTQAARQTDDVQDPFRQSDEAFDLMKAEMDPALAVIVRYVSGQLEHPTA